MNTTAQENNNTRKDKAANKITFINFRDRGNVYNNKLRELKRLWAIRDAKDYTMTDVIKHLIDQAHAADVKKVKKRSL